MKYTYLLTGFEDYKCSYDNEDLQFCKQNAADKPVPVPSEFTELGTILMEENNWYMPNNCCEALCVYLDMLNAIEQEI